MESIRYSLLIREYWNDFRRNFNQRTVLTSTSPLCILPAWVNVLTGNYGSQSMLTIFLLFPSAFFLYFAFNTHADLIPAMFYLLPLSRAQREQYIRRTTAVRILIPGAVCVAWFVLISCFRPLEAIGMLIGCAGCLLGCTILYLSQAVEYTHSYGAVLDVIAAFLLVGLSFLASLSTEVGRLIWGAVFLLCSIRFWGLYRKFHAGCIRYSRYETKVSEEQKK